MKCDNHAVCGNDPYFLLEGRLCVPCFNAMVKESPISADDLPSTGCEERPCKWCGVMFSPKYSTRLYHSDECKRLAGNERDRMRAIAERVDKAPLPQIPCALDSCRIMFTPKESKNTFHSKECLRIRAKQRQKVRRDRLRADGKKVV